MKNILTIIFAFLGFSVTAQNASEALRYSFLEIGGTARTVSVGGGLGALGADFSVMSTNPAGLAAYRASEFTLTPTFELTGANAQLSNSDGRDSMITGTKFNFNNLGLVIATQPTGKMKTVNFGIGFNRLANFNRVFAYSGKNKGSYVNRWVELATDGSGNPIPPDGLDGFEAGLAYEVGAIFDPFDDGYQEWSSDFAEDPEVSKEQRVRTKGAINELVIGLAGNYNEKLLFGATLGVLSLRYSERKTYTEMDNGGGKDGDIPAFIDLRFVEDLETTGIGVNLKLGVIYRITQAFRLGVALHTPNFYNLEDTFFTELEYTFSGANGQAVTTERNSPDGTFGYGLRSPLRVLTSAAFIIKKKGFITAEVEWADYSTSQFNLTRNRNTEDDRLYERQVNQDIEDQFQSAVNIRLGGEYALENYRFRLGTGFQGTPYTDGSILSNYFTTGLGYRGESFYVDLAYRLSLLEEGYIPYLLDQVPDPNSPSDLIPSPNQLLVNNRFTNHKIMMTLGFRF